jgi:hypothetical protein
MSASEDGAPIVETSEKKGRFKVKNVSIFKCIKTI